MPRVETATPGRVNVVLHGYHVAFDRLLVLLDRPDCNVYQNSSMTAQPTVTAFNYPDDDQVSFWIDEDKKNPVPRVIEPEFSGRIATPQDASRYARSVATAHGYIVMDKPKVVN